MGKIEIYNEDNMILMAKYPDKHFDLAIVDPPYGINMDGGHIGGGTQNQVSVMPELKKEKQNLN